MRIICAFLPHLKCIDVMNEPAPDRYVRVLLFSLDREQQSKEYHRALLRARKDVVWTPQCNLAASLA